MVFNTELIYSNKKRVGVNRLVNLFFFIIINSIYYPILNAERYVNIHISEISMPQNILVMLNKLNVRSACSPIVIMEYGLIVNIRIRLAIRGVRQGSPLSAFECSIKLEIKGDFLIHLITIKSKVTRPVI